MRAKRVGEPLSNKYKGNKIIDWRAPKTGIVMGCITAGVVVAWHNKQVQVVSNASRYERFYGKKRYEIVQ